MNTEQLKKIAVEVSRILLGGLFIFSGFVKAVDPLGSAYKFHDYFTAFGWNSLDVVGLPMSFALSAIEFALGVCILIAVYRKLTTFLILLLMIFMTSLTLYSAITNPVTDCGCFGDALVLSNWGTFYKNIVLLALSVIAFWRHRYLMPVFSAKSSWLAALYAFLFILSVSSYCYGNLPILDFRPYKIGANIPELMVVPEGAPQDEYLTTFIYEKEGVKQEFTLENYPADDPTWKFVDSKPKLLKKGYQPPIHDFTITAERGDDITAEVLEDPSYTFLLIAHKLKKANDSNVDKVNEIYDFSRRFGYRFYMLTASTPDEIREWIENTGAEYEICTADEITLKTIVRSNPGLMLLKQGVIIHKWPDSHLPSGEILDKPVDETPLSLIPPNHNAGKILACACLLFVPLALLFGFDFLYYRRRKENGASN